MEELRTDPRYAGIHAGVEGMKPYADYATHEEYEAALAAHERAERRERARIFSWARPKYTASAPASMAACKEA